MILLRGFLSSGTEGRGLELWLADSESLPAPVLKMVLLILTGGAGGLSSGSPLSHIFTSCHRFRRALGSTVVKDGQGGRQKGREAALTSTRCEAVIIRYRRMNPKWWRMRKTSKWHLQKNNDTVKIIIIQEYFYLFSPYIFLLNKSSAFILKLTCT